MEDILIVIDMQNDFITGSLGSEDAQKIVPNVVEKIKKYEKAESMIILTQDTHYDNYLSTFEGRKLPIKHCIANTDGWQIEDKIYDEINMYKNKINILKHNFGSLELINYLKKIINDEEQKDFNIEIIGLCLNVCVISNAVLLKAAFPETNLFVNLNCTAATDDRMFQSTVDILDSLQIGVKYE